MIGRQRQFIAHPDQRHNKAQLARQLSPDAGNPRHQRRALALVDQPDQRIADVEAQRCAVVDFAPFDGTWRGKRRQGDLGYIGFPVQPPSKHPRACGRW